jgi:phosphatidylglycerol:prolipoprotein diacylglycerol transferase
MPDPDLNIGPLSIRWYSVFLIIGISLAYFLIRRQIRKKNLKLEDFDSLFLLTIICGLFGARLYHVIDYWSYYQLHLTEIFFIWQGGLGIFGALLFGLLAVVWFSRKQKFGLLALLDLVTPYLLLGQALGRMGNYYNQEGYGPPTSLPWGVFIEKAQATVHPTFFYEGLWDAIGSLILIYYQNRLKKGQVTGLYLTIYGSGRLLAEYWRVDTFAVGDLKIGYGVALFLVLVGLYLYLKSTKLGKHFGGHHESGPTQ